MLTSQVFQWPGERHGNTHALSRQTTNEPAWKEGQEDAAIGSCPKPMKLETASANLREPEVFDKNGAFREKVA